ncbi:MAG TPA: phospho-N-acetylmuramoyl-pentapeptide-transferase [Chroococcales cyanobacterium]
MEALATAKAANYMLDLWKFGLGACFVTAILMPFYIAYLKHLQVTQFIREEGPASHTVKAKTPTAGGVCFIFAALITCLYWMSIDYKLPNLEMCLILAWGLICGGIGFVDDFAKIKSKSNKGLSARMRFLSELGLGFVLSGVVATLLVNHSSIQLPSYSFGAVHNALPKDYFTQVVHHYFGVNNAGTQIQPLPVWLFMIFGSIVTVSCANALNLHDGMDGLAAGTSIQVFVVMAVMFYAMGQPPCAFVSAIMAGVLTGFLFYNKYPAKIFMGDTGSLFIGGIMAGLVIVGGIAVWFIPLALIYILEAVSVMIQVSTFKLTKEYKPETPMSAPALAWYKLTHRLPGEGKRVFRMAPLHHHFEAVLAEEGVKEWQVVVGFWLFQFALAVMTVIIFTFIR